MLWLQYVSYSNFLFLRYGLLLFGAKIGKILGTVAKDFVWQLISKPTDTHNRKVAEQITEKLRSKKAKSCGVKKQKVAE